MSAQQQLQLAKSLPPRLLRFFQKFPPASIVQCTVASTPTTPAEPLSASTTAPIDPNVSPIESSSPIVVLSSSYPRNLPPTAIQDAQTLPYHNPFLPRKSHTTGRWHSPLFGLRQQADLVKLATSHGVVDLLPWTIKKPGEKEARRIESGLRVKGTGEGQRVKGKLWERTLKGRLETRRKAMLDMPRLVQEWKQVCHLLRSGVDSVDQIANMCIERSWSGLEKVAEWKGEEVDGGTGSQIAMRRWCGSKLNLTLQLGCFVYPTCTAWLKRHISGVIFPLYHIMPSFISRPSVHDRNSFMFNKVSCSLIVWRCRWVSGIW
jgi:large subunit ribosomal protein L25